MGVTFSDDRTQIGDHCLPSIHYLAVHQQRDSGGCDKPLLHVFETAERAGSARRMGDRPYGGTSIRAMRRKSSLPARSRAICSYCGIAFWQSGQS